MKGTKLEANIRREQGSVIKQYENLLTEVSERKTRAQNSTSQPINTRKEMKRLSNSMSSHNPQKITKKKSIQPSKFAHQQRRALFSLTDIPKLFRKSDTLEPFKDEMLPALHMESVRTAQ